MVNLQVPPKPDEPLSPPLVQLSFEADSASSSSSSSTSEEEEDDDNDKAFCCGLRVNPKRSFGLVGPDFSFLVESNSLILQDRESETESFKNPIRTSSERSCDNNNNQFHHQHHKKMKLPSNDHDDDHHHKNKTGSSSWVEPEPVSSISDATPEEEAALSLMMLSRDKWERQDQKDEEEEEDEDDEDEEDEEDEDDEDGERSVEDSDEFYEEMKSTKTISVRVRYKCDICNKVFRSYQALGGHRASCKKIKSAAICESEIEQQNNNNNAPAMAGEKKIHECPVCFRVFASGQALGGHKRTHVTGSATSVVVRTTPSTTKFGDNDNKGLMDLNLPAPVDEYDEISQSENSADSDAESL